MKYRKQNYPPSWNEVTKKQAKVLAAELQRIKSGAWTRAMTFDEAIELITEWELKK